MKRSTGGFAVYQFLGALAVVGVAIYLQAWVGVLIGIGLILPAVLFYFVEKRAQRSLERDE